MQLNLLSPPPKTHDDSAHAHSSSSPVYGINLELLFKEDLSLAMHGKCLRQEFSNMLVHCVKTDVLVKTFHTAASENNSMIRVLACDTW